MMGGRMLNGGNRRTTYFVLSILLVSSLPMLTNASAEDVGIPSDLQAQDIQVTFDNVSETTTVTWRNIAQAGGDLDLYAELWDATYHVYRHDAPITPSNIDDLTPWHSVIAVMKMTSLNLLTAVQQETIHTPVTLQPTRLELEQMAHFSTQ